MNSPLEGDWGEWRACDPKKGWFTAAMEKCEVMWDPENDREEG